MLQRAMSVKVGQQPDPAFINTLLGTNFGAMEKLGPSVLYPFLQVHSLQHLPCLASRWADCWQWLQMIAC